MEMEKRETPTCIRMSLAKRIGKWVLRLSPIWGSTLLVAVMLHFGISTDYLVLMNFAIAIILFCSLFFATSKDQLILVCGGVAVFILTQTAFEKSPSDTLIYQDNILVAASGESLSYGFWRRDEFTVIPNTHQVTVAFNAPYINQAGNIQTLRVRLSYDDLPEKVLLAHHRQGSSPDYKELFWTALAKATLTTLQNASPQDPATTLRAIQQHMDRQLETLSASVTKLSVTLDGKKSVQTYTATP